MATQALGKINGRLRFLYRNQNFLTNSLKRLLCNALIQPHFDFACLAWYPNLNKRLKGKVQVAQNKCIRFCLNLENRAHIGASEFEIINWLPTKNRFEQCILSNIYNFFNNNAPLYIAELYHPAEQGHVTRTSFRKLLLPNKNTNRGLRNLNFIGPQLWNSLPSEIKQVGSVNTFKHKVKERFFTELQANEETAYILY